jgi:murein DD-endopeptidase MepM/ murein hydrolase activator NlpD
MQICKTKRKIWLPVILLFPLIFFLISCGYGIYHKVQKGETLQQIAKKYNVPEKEIIEANKKGPFNFDPQKIKEGDLIWIPLDKASAEIKNEFELKEKLELKEKSEPKEKPEYQPKSTNTETQNQKTQNQKIEDKDKKYEDNKNNNDNNKKWETGIGTKIGTQTIKDKKDFPSLAKVDIKRDKIASDNKISLKFIKPVEGKIISGFGPRNGKMHKGIDIQAPEGESIKAAEDGVVIFSGFLKGYGNVIIIKHEEDFFTVYAHNKVNLVKEGEFVKKGQVIGKVGMTGNAQIPHLHFEIRKKTKPLDPTKYIQE